MKKISFFHIRGLAVALLSAMALPFVVSCDEHEPIDRDVHVGYVLCDDHSVMSREAYFDQLGGGRPVTAVGVVFAVEDENHPTLAVMLFEQDGVQFTNKLGLGCGTSQKVDAFDGYANSVSMNNTYQQEKVKVDSVEYTYTYCSPLGRWVFASHEFGQSDYVPSYAECRLLQSSLGIVNPVIEALGGVPVSVSSEGGRCWYWTSTEDADDSGNRAWLCSMATGGFQQTPKTEFHHARAIVSLSY